MKTTIFSHAAAITMFMALAASVAVIPSCSKEESATTTTSTETGSYSRGAMLISDIKADSVKLVEYGKSHTAN
jgi:hypothetical protein